MARSWPELTRSLKRVHAAPRDSFSFCLKGRTSIRRLTALEMGKKDKQKLEHRASQSSCTLSTVRVYQCLALPVKENKNRFHFKVHVTCLRYTSMHRFAQTLVGGYMGFHHLLLRKNVPRPNLLIMNATHS